MRGRTGDSHAPGSTCSLLNVLPRGNGLSWLALVAALVPAGLGWGGTEGAEMGGEPSAATSEAGFSDGTSLQAATAASEPLSSGQTKAADDPRSVPDRMEAPTERASWASEEEALLESIMTIMRRGYPNRREDWQAPLPDLVYERILFDSPRLAGPVMAAIELHHNEASFNLLLKYGLKDIASSREGAIERRRVDCAMKALQFLRAYDPTDEARAEVEKRLQLTIQQSEGDDVAASRAAHHVSHLKSLLGSWDFAQGLSEPRRKTYQDYERRRWMALALTRPSHSRGRSPDRFTQASYICPWPEGDEEFFLRNFESPASTVEDVRLSGYIAFLQPDGTFRFSDEGIRRLEAVAEGDSPWADYAARILPRLKNQEEQ